MHITIVKIGTPETIPTGKGRPYRKLEVLYRNEKWFTNSHKLISFKNPSVFKMFENAQEGQEFEVDVVKNESGFNEWKSAVPAGASPTVVAEATKGELPAVNKQGAAANTPIRVQVTESDRNRYIVRQSSLERAIAYHEAAAIQPTVESVCSIAAAFETWVFRPVEVQVATAKEASAVVKEVAAQADAVQVTRKPGRPKKVIEMVEETEQDEVE